MNYKPFTCFIFFLIFNFGLSQETAIPGKSGIIASRIKNLDEALLQKDTVSLNGLLHEKLTLGHSNGWIESKESLLKTLPTSKVKYNEFKNTGKPEIEFVNENLSTVRRNLEVTGEYENEPFEVDLKILEIWILEDEHWQLLARQSVEVKFE